MRIELTFLLYPDVLNFAEPAAGIEPTFLLYPDTKSRIACRSVEPTTGLEPIVFPLRRDCFAIKLRRQEISILDWCGTLLQQCSLPRPNFHINRIFPQATPQDTNGI